VKENNFIINYTTKGKLPRLPFVHMKNAVLGDKYELSVNVIGKTAMQTLNRTYRGINAPTDILSFPLDQASGEIFINIEETKKEAKKFERPYENFVAFLFIHGLVHLTGLDHGDKMEKEEIKFRKKFGI
jgi:probable rRNA maturation factor